jgi:hypothetical protein
MWNNTVLAEFFPGVLLYHRIGRTVPSSRNVIASVFCMLRDSSTGKELSHVPCRILFIFSIFLNIIAQFI